MTNTNKKTNNNTIEFVNVMCELKFDNIRSTIEQSNEKKVEFKTLTLDILDATKSMSDIITLKMFSECLERWEENNKQGKCWTEELESFCKSKSDITELYIIDDSSKNIFIIVMEDSTNETVFEYNDFALSLLKENESIDDFMVVDCEEISQSEDLLINFKKIYERG